MANEVSESEYQSALMRKIGSHPRFRLWRQLNGNFYWRNERTGEYHPVRLGPPKGAADLTGFVWGTGRRIELEVKSASGRVSEDQVKWGLGMNAGCVLHRIAKYDPARSLEYNVDREMAWLEAAS